MVGTSHPSGVPVGALPTDLVEPCAHRGAAPRRHPLAPVERGREIFLSVNLDRSLSASARAVRIASIRSIFAACDPCIREAKQRCAPPDAGCERAHPRVALAVLPQFVTSASYLSLLATKALVGRASSVSEQVRWASPSYQVVLTSVAFSLTAIHVHTVYRRRANLPSPIQYQYVVRVPGRLGWGD